MLGRSGRRPARREVEDGPRPPVVRAARPGDAKPMLGRQDGRGGGGHQAAPVGRGAQRPQHRPGRPGAAGHRALDGRGVPVVAADVQAVAEVDRPPERAAGASAAGCAPITVTVVRCSSVGRRARRARGRPRRGRRPRGSAPASSSRPAPGRRGCRRGWASVTTTVLTSCPPGSPSTISGAGQGDSGQHVQVGGDLAGRRGGHHRAAGPRRSPGRWRRPPRRPPVARRRCDRPGRDAR